MSKLVIRVIKVTVLFVGGQARAIRGIMNITLFVGMQARIFEGFKRAGEHQLFL